MPTREPQRPDGVVSIRMTRHSPPRGSSALVKDCARYARSHNSISDPHMPVRKRITCSMLFGALARQWPRRHGWLGWLRLNAGFPVFWLPKFSAATHLRGRQLDLPVLPLPE
jgi:hypothetical protein